MTNTRERKLWTAIGCLSALQALTLLLLFTGSQRPLAVVQHPETSLAGPRRALLENLDELVYIKDGEVVIDAPLRVLGNSTFGTQGERDTGVLIESGLRVIGMTKLNAVQVRHTTELGVHNKGAYNATDAPLQVWGAGAEFRDPAVTTGNPLTLVRAGEVLTYRDTKKTEYKENPQPGDSNLKQLS